MLSQLYLFGPGLKAWVSCAELLWRECLNTGGAKKLTRWQIYLRPLLHLSIICHTHTHNMSGSNRTSTADNCPQINRELKQQEFGRVCKMSIEYSSSQHDSPLQKLTCHMCVCKYVISTSGLTSTNF